MNRRLNLKRQLEDGGVESDSDDGGPVAAPRQSSQGGEGKRVKMSYVNKQRCLVFGSRGLGSRYRHLMEDVRALLPHHKREVKLDTKDNLQVINEIADVKTCNTTLYFECRKKQDLYLWVSRTPHGPSAKFLVQNVHTMDELKLTGNCLKGSRPILNFDEAFDQLPHLVLLRNMFTEIFATPRGHPKSKPFIDRVMSFFWVDGRVWIRNYQIQDQAESIRLEKQAAKKGTDLTQLAEIGPRMVLNLIRIFSGSFGGQTLYQNPEFTSPNLVRKMKLEAVNNKYKGRKDQEQARDERRAGVVVPPNPLTGVFAEGIFGGAAGASAEDDEDEDEDEEMEESEEESD